jgi:hypothetical protein
MNTEQQIYALAFLLDITGNTGSYVSTCVSSYGIDPRDTKPKARTGILFYSKGHGWRVRKSPYWRDVFFERYPELPYINAPLDTSLKWGYQVGFCTGVNATEEVKLEAFHNLLMPTDHSENWRDIIRQKAQWIAFTDGWTKAKTWLDEIPF